MSEHDFKKGNAMSKELSQIQQLLSKIDAIYEAIHHRHSQLTDSEEGKYSASEGSETVAYKHEPYPQQALFERYSQSFYGRQDSPSRVTAAYRNAHNEIRNVLQQLGCELNEIFGVKEISGSANETFDPRQVISRLQVRKAMTVFIWMLISHFEDKLDYEVQTWKIEGAEFVLEPDLVESIRRVAAQRSETSAAIASPTTEAQQ